jgi:hypothetical protein
MNPERQARGKYAKTSGDRAMREVIKYVRANGAPQASRMASPHMGDLAGGPPGVVFEITNEGWDQLGKKARQAEGDAAYSKLPRWAVVKPRRRDPDDTGPVDTGRAWCITPFGQYWADQMELAELRTIVRAIRGAS